jgi:hypothetical protein
MHSFTPSSDLRLPNKIFYIICYFMQSYLFVYHSYVVVLFSLLRVLSTVSRFVQESFTFISSGTMCSRRLYLQTPITALYTGLRTGSHCCCRCITFTTLFPSGVDD